MSFVYCLFLLLALVCPAFGQDGRQAAASAIEAAQQLKSYVDTVARSGGVPDYSKPPASQFLHAVFDSDRLAAVPFDASDKPWLLEWGKAAADAYTTIARFRAQPGQAIDEGLLRQNAEQYSDAFGMALAFNVRIQARLAAETQMYTDARAPGLEAAREAVARIMTDAIVAIRVTGPSGGRAIATALRETAAAWLPFVSAHSRGEIMAHLLKTLATVQDPGTTESLGVLASEIRR
jgi:hypothetical protein